ncbi:MAG: FMN-binding protein [Micrococcales bacterium]
MERKTRMALGNAVIATASIAGALGLTNYLTAAQGGLFGANTASTASAGSDKTVQGDAIQYRYGTVQVEVVRTSGKISAINLLQSDATAGREQAYPILVQYALDAQGTNFGNLSGATFTTDAFKQALNSAISKLG